MELLENCLRSSQMRTWTQMDYKLLTKNISQINLFSPSLLLSPSSMSPQLTWPSKIFALLLGSLLPLLPLLQIVPPQEISREISLKHMPHYTTVLLQILSCVCISLRIKLELHHGLSCLTPFQPILIPTSPFPSLKLN